MIGEKTRTTIRTAILNFFKLVNAIGWACIHGRLREDLLVTRADRHAGAWRRKTSDGVELSTSCVIEGPKSGLRVEAYQPPNQVNADVERIFAATKIEVGGVEYITDVRDGRLYYYDINALSNFVADGPTLLGFDPFVRLVDYLEQEAS